MHIKDKTMKRIKNIKNHKTKELTQRISNFSPIIIGKFLYNFYRLTPNQKIYILKTMENIRKYNL